MIIVKIMGGLGNQLFQYSTGRAISIRFGTELKLDLSMLKNSDDKIAYRLDRFNLPFTVAIKEECDKLKNLKTKSKLPNLLKRIGIKIYPYYKKTHISEDEVLKLLSSDKIENKNFYIEGWLARESYFVDYRETLIKDLNVDYMLNDYNKTIRENMIKENSVAIHIRRGDYLLNPYFIKLPINYYKKAIELVSKKVYNPSFYFFSDDIEWVKKEFSFLRHAKYVDRNSKKESFYTTIGDIEDLMLMRTCKHNIIANSTFSWWGAWLNENPNKIVIAPKRAYNNENAQNNYIKSSFIPKEWIKI